MTDWETSRARLELFTSVMPRAVGSARAARRGDPPRGVPPSARGARIVGESMIDEFFIAVNSVTRKIPDTAEISTSVDRCAAVASDVADLGVYGVNLEPQVAEINRMTSKKFGTIRFQLVDYSSDITLPAPIAKFDPYAGRSASMRLLRRGGAGKRWIVWVHGAAQGRSDDLYAFRADHLHETLGYEVALPVLPAHGRRRIAGLSYPGMDPLSNVAVNVRAIAEIRSLILWISTQDPSEIVIAGTSLGGPLAAMVASLQPQVTSVLAVVPMLDMHATLAHHMDRGGERGRELAELMRDDAVRAVSSVVDPLAVEPIPANGRRMVIAALNDRVTSVRSAQRLHDHWDGRVHWFRGSHVGHAFSKNVRSVVDGFLA